MSRKHSLDAAAREQLRAAARNSARRASETIVGGHEHVMRQTVIALLKDASLSEHENPGEATLFVITGRVTLTVPSGTDTDTWEGRTGDLIEIPPMRHSLTAIEDSAVLLTAVPRSR